MKGRYLLAALLLAQVFTIVFAGGGITNVTMKASVVSERSKEGDFSHISYRDMSVPKCCSSTELLIAANASSVNPVDWKLIAMNFLPIRYPHIPGFDSAGTVVKAGAKSGFKVGDEVWLMADNTYAQYVVSDGSKVGLKPKSMSMIEAASIPLASLTSLQCLQKTGAPWKKPSGKEFTVVVTSGSGGTGYVAIQMAKAFGATKVITSTSSKNIDFVKSMGADVVIDYHKTSIWATLSNDTVDVVYDNFGAPGTADDAMPSLKEGGVFIFLPGKNGALSNPNPNTNPNPNSR